MEVGRRLDWQGQGIELSSAAAKASQERFSIQVFAGRIDDFSAQSQNYDLITLWDIIEHVTNPRQLLAKCAQLVKKNGLLVIETPNSRALINKVAYFPFLKISSLDLNFLGSNLAVKPSDWQSKGYWLLAIPVVTGLLQYWQTKMMAPPTQALVQKDNKKGIPHRIPA